ncbi:unnamed protein product [Protopolystoma xenopodis]|uniref:Uncharacterized protein n=1 Tax=Protopolystoma xenopodis TaxID=117903 RepID=A0A448X636_9PLAT|nr:unnamed protein product [Protopolystoma xenopodis]
MVVMLIEGFLLHGIGKQLHMYLELAHYQGFLPKMLQSRMFLLIKLDSHIYTLTYLCSIGETKSTTF